jgi:hypothetical protein
MWEFAVCVLEVIVVLLALNIVMKLGNRGMYTSDPSIAAAIGNAANRKFENSQVGLLGASDKGMFANPAGPGPVWPQNPTMGYMSPPESMAWTGGSK